MVSLASKLDIYAYRRFCAPRMGCRDLKMVMERKQGPWDIVDSSLAQNP
jgi:hypothetical protein